MDIATQNAKSGFPVGEFRDLRGKGIENFAHFLYWEWVAEKEYYEYPYWNLSGEKLGYRRRYVNPKTFRFTKRVPDGLSKSHPDKSYYFLPAYLKPYYGFYYLVEGETSLMSMYAAGQANSLGTFGATNVPETLVSDLRTLQANELRVIIDNDKAGRQLALSARKLLKDTDINLVVLSLSHVVEDKGDLNDLWISCAFNPEDFRHIIRNLEVIHLAPPPPLSPEKKRKYEEKEEGFARLRQVIAQHLPITGYKKNGYTKHFICINPEHIEDTASAGFHLDQGYKCFGCGKKHDVQVAEWLNISNWRDIVFKDD